MRKLTPREQVLVYIAAFMILICGGFWLVHTMAFSHYDEGQNQLEFAKMERQMANHDIESEKELEDNLRKGQEYYLEHEKDLELFKSEAQLEAQLLSYLEICGLSPEKTQVFPISVLGEDGEVIKTYVGSILMTVQGEFNNLQSFFQLIEGKNGMRIEAFHMIDTEDMVLADIKINCYMLDASDVNEVEIDENTTQ